MRTIRIAAKSYNEASFGLPPLGRAIAPLGHVIKVPGHEINDFIAKSFKSDTSKAMTKLSRPRSYIYNDPRSFQPTAKNKLISLIRKRNKRTGTTYYSRQQIVDGSIKSKTKPAQDWLKKLGEKYNALRVTRDANNR